MVHYEFMKPENLKNKKSIYGYVREKYGIKLSKEVMEEGNTILHDYLKNRIYQYKTEACLEDRLKAKYQEYTTQDVNKERMIIEISKIVYNPVEYIDDLVSAIYMGILFNDPVQDSFSVSTNKPSKKPDESISDYKIKVKLLKQLEKERYEINSVWERKSNSNKINKDCVRKNYPIPIKGFTGGESTIVSIPGGCFQYHKTLISTKHIGLFDTRTDVKDYKRYSFMKMHQLYEKLKESQVENLLLMEYSLGIGYANHIYQYVFDINSYEQWRKLSEVVTISMQLSPFFIRKKLAAPIWEYIKKKGYVDDVVEEIIGILACVNEVVSYIYEDILELWWYAHYLFPNENKKYEMTCLLSYSWERYFSEEKAYMDSIKFCGISDWRKIKRANDCFFYLEGYPNFEASEKREHFHEKEVLVPITLVDFKGESNVIYVEKIIDARINPMANEIGQKIIEETIERIYVRGFPRERADVYKMYYDIREEVFREMKKSETVKFNKKDIKKPKENGTMKPQHVYAVLQEEIIQCLLYKV